MGGFKDFAGQRFGRLVALSPAAQDGRRRTMWHCACDCGGALRVRTDALTGGNTVSCGCGSRGRRRHGDSYCGGRRRPSPEYVSWRAMKNRMRPTHDSFKYYGGRGIKVCERWLRYENFLADMGRKPSPIHSIDRIDTDGHYEPGNCRWATPAEQTKNRRRSPG